MSPVPGCTERSRSFLRSRVVLWQHAWSCTKVKPCVVFCPRAQSRARESVARRPVEHRWAPLATANPHEPLRHRTCCELPCSSQGDGRHNAHWQGCAQNEDAFLQGRSDPRIARPCEAPGILFKISQHDHTCPTCRAPSEPLLPVERWTLNLVLCCVMTMPRSRQCLHGSFGYGVFSAQLLPAPQWLPMTNSRGTAAAWWTFLLKSGQGRRTRFGLLPALPAESDRALASALSCSTGAAIALWCSPPSGELPRRRAHDNSRSISLAQKRRHRTWTSARIVCDVTLWAKESTWPSMCWG